MARMGFIQDKLEINFLLLYIASRLIEPVPFEAMQELRAVADELEGIVGENDWPFPTYGALLFSV